jgi:hypothetical protein
MLMADLCSVAAESMRKSKVNIREAETTVAIWCVLDKFIHDEYTRTSAFSGERTIKLGIHEVVASFAWKKLNFGQPRKQLNVAIIKKQLKALGFEDVHVHLGGDCGGYIFVVGV